MSTVGANLRIDVPDELAKELSEALDGILVGHYNNVRLQLWGCEVVFYNDPILGIKSFINDTAD